MAIAYEISEISDDYAVHLAMSKNDDLLQAVSRKRKKKQMCLQIPTPTDRHFDFPDEFAPFALQDSGKIDMKRLLLFGDATVKNLLNLLITWLVDGTFKLSPPVQYIRSTYQFENAVPYLKAVAKFRLKTFIEIFGMFWFFFSGIIFLSSE